MKKCMRSCVIVLLMLAFIMSAIPSAAVSIPDGSSVQAQNTGTDYSGYTEVSTKEELNAIRNDLSGKYVLTADIVFTPSDFANGGAFYNGGAGWEPIGNLSAPFTGIFDGNGHVIENLKINITSGTTVYAGLFGMVERGAVKNLGMVNSDIKVTLSSSSSALYVFAGGIIGELPSYSYTLIDNCYNTGSVAVNINSTSKSAGAYAGGIVGEMGGNSYSTVKNCHNTGAVSAEARGAGSSGSAGGYAGGIAAAAYGVLLNCYNTGDLTAYSEMGNLSYSSAMAGGIMGSGDADVVSCYNSGRLDSSAVSRMSASSYSGGIAASNTGAIADCYNTGYAGADAEATSTSAESRANAYAGGITAYRSNSNVSDRLTVTRCYNTADVNAEAACVSASRPANAYMGSIVGYSALSRINGTTIYNCYYLDTGDKGVGYGSGYSNVISCTEEQLKSADTYSGFDFDGTWTMEGSAGYFYPELLYIIDPDFTVEIYTKEQLDKLRDNRFGRYKLCADIVFDEADFAEGGDFYNGGALWQPICSDTQIPFAGVFDGDGHKIVGLSVNAAGNAYAGLFGHIDGGTVMNLSMCTSGTNEISSESGYAGGIAGSMDNGLISGCFNSVSIRGGKAGGILGWAKGGEVADSYNTADVTAYVSYKYEATAYAGGIAASAARDFTIVCCYNTGNVYSFSETTAQSISYNAFSYAYGITAGSCNITECYNTGNVRADASVNYNRAYAYAGGIANGGVISRSYNTADVTAFVECAADASYNTRNSYAGGIANPDSSTVITDCFNIGDITAVAPYEAIAGGIAGLANGGSIINSYNIGDTDAAVSHSWTENPSVAYQDEILGKDLYGSVTLSNCYYEALTAGEGANGEIGCTKEQMMSMSTYSGFDFDGVWTMAGDEYYLYPELKAVEMIYEREVESFEISSLPDKLTYLEGKDTLDLRGGKLTVKYADGGTEDIDMTPEMIGGFDNTVVGNQILTVTYKDRIKVFNIVITAKSLASIEISSLPEKLSYIEAKDQLELTGALLTLYYNNDTHEEINITISMVTGFDNTIVGLQTLTVAYSGMTDSFDIEIIPKTLVSIGVTKRPDKCNYLELKEELDLTGGLLALYYDNGTTEYIDISEAVVTGFDNTVPGNKTLTVSYGGMTAYFTVSITAKSLTLIEISALPEKLGYLEAKDQLDLTGGLLTLYYNNDTHEEINVSPYMVTGFDNTIVGVQTLTVSYGGMTDSFDIEIIAKSLTSIEVTKLPEKLSYLEGKDTLDITGGLLTLCYNNDTHEEINITLSMVTGFDNTIVGVQTLTVSYGGMTDSFDIEIIAKSLTSIEVTKLPEKLTYLEANDQLDITGGEITLYYNNGTSDVVTMTPSMVSGFDISAAGEVTITVTHGGVSSGYTARVEHDFSELNSDGEGHYYSCKSCSAAGEKLPHEGGSADCTNKAVCSVCQREYGNSLGHDFVTGNVYHTDDSVHAKKCSRCQEYDTPLPHEYGSGNACDACGYIKTVTHTHAYTNTVVAEEYRAGFATCHSKASYYKSCECGERGSETFESGEYDGSNHTSTATKAVSGNNGTHDVIYICCGGTKSDNIPCRGGTATCTASARCTDCRAEYGSKNPANHSRDTFTYTPGDESSHVKNHACCGAVASSAEPHTFGADGKCTSCGAESVHVHSYGEWIGNADGHFHECSCGDRKDEAVHVYDNACDSLCDICGYERSITHSYTVVKADGLEHLYVCEICSAEKDGSRTPHEGGEADCTHRAVCTVCGAEYGDTAPDNHDFSDKWIIDEESHRHECSRCSEERDRASHEYGEDGRCVCGIEKAAEESEEDDNTLLIVIISVTLSLALIGGGFALWWFKFRNVSKNI